MKKIFVTVLFATFIMAFAACDKENENTAGTHVTREYLLDDFTASHLAFHRTDTSAYQTIESADTIDIIGVEYEIWNLAKHVK